MKPAGPHEDEHQVGVNQRGSVVKASRTWDEKEGVGGRARGAEAVPTVKEALEHRVEHAGALTKASEQLAHKELTLRSDESQRSCP